MKTLMKKKVAVIALLAVALIVGVAVKVNVSANETEGECQPQPIQEQQGKTFYAVLEEIDYYSYCKGNDGTRTLVYSVNGGEQITDVLKCQLGNSYGNAYAVYSYEFPNVKEGDVITYKYTYVNTYAGIPIERGNSGEIIVKFDEEAKENIDEELKSYSADLVKYSYYSYAKGGNTTHNITYSVNGGEEQTGVLESAYRNVNCGVPEYVAYSYNFPNVKKGDLIIYKISYVNNYSGTNDERVIEGSLVVE